MHSQNNDTHSYKIIIIISIMVIFKGITITITVSMAIFTNGIRYCQKIKAVPIDIGTAFIPVGNAWNLAKKRRLKLISFFLFLVKTLELFVYRLQLIHLAGSGI